MQPNNLTALDFEDIKSSIKSYLRTRNEFTDYDFEGSTLSYLVDTLAYNSYYTAFNANMALNEAFLPSSTVRDNVVNLAKLLNYVPRSIQAAKACLKLELQTTQVNGAYPSNITLKKGPVATGGNFVWNVLADTTVEVNTTTGIATFDKVTIKEGSIVNFQYIVNTFADGKDNCQKIELDENDLDKIIMAIRNDKLVKDHSGFFFGNSTEFGYYEGKEKEYAINCFEKAKKFIRRGEELYESDGLFVQPRSVFYEASW